MIERRGIPAERRTDNEKYTPWKVVLGIVTFLAVAWTGIYFLYKFLEGVALEFIQHVRFWGLVRGATERFFPIQVE